MRATQHRDRRPVAARAGSADRRKCDHSPRADRDGDDREPPAPPAAR